jgi:hypothetical protein
VVWATDLQEAEELEGGGKGSPEYLAYKYSVSFAVALSSRRLRAVRRIWADGKLLRGAAGDFKVETKFRFYPGDEDQAIDPLIASVETIDSTPAFRGLALALFEDLALAEFGNRIPVLTFEVEADEGEVDLGALLDDAGMGAIAVGTAGQTIDGYAAHGSSVGDGLATLIAVAGVELCERDGRLSLPLAPVVVPLEAELGSSADARPVPRLSRERAAESGMPASLAMTYYDAARDYQAGEAKAASGSGGRRDERIELPAVLDAGAARTMVEQSLARRWREGETLKVRLSPRHLAMRPGDRLLLAEGSWTARSVEIDGMAVVVDAIRASGAVAALPSDPGRPVREEDEPIGRTELRLFELPAMGDQPETQPLIQLAVGNDGAWRTVPVEVVHGTEQSVVSVAVEAAIGIVEGSFGKASAHLADERNEMIVQMTDNRPLLSVTDDALAQGGNLAMVGPELMQFGRAEPLGGGRYRLSRLLRGRWGTEWAAGPHLAGEAFQLVDARSIRAIPIERSAVGVEMSATAHGIGDVAPLPTVVRTVSGEAMRPLAPAHLSVAPLATSLRVSWIRRTQRGWDWPSQLDTPADDFSELYRLSLSGPGGQRDIDSAATTVDVAWADVPAAAGQPLSISLVAVGPFALSRPAQSSLIV